MLYVQQSLGPDEEIILAARFHWMYTVSAISWILIGLGGAIAAGYGAVWWEVSSAIRSLYPGLPEHLFPNAWDHIVQAKGGYLKILWEVPSYVRLGVLGLFLFGLFMFAHMMIVRATTEIAITSQRIIYKKGLIARDVGEMSVNRVEGVSVRQGILGRIFGYGQVCIRGMGVGEIVLPPIEDPVAFCRASQEAKSLDDRVAVPNADMF